MKQRAKLWMVLLIALLMAAVFLPAAVFAVEETEITIIDSGTCGAEGDNLTWTMASDGTLTISGEGEMADYSDNSKTPWYPFYPYYNDLKITSVIIEEGVTSVGNHAFDYFSSIKSIQLPKGLKEIGSHAFNYCYNLEELVIPDSVTTIGYSAFESCGFSSINIPKGVTVIGESVFSNCSKLTSVTLPDGLTEIGDSAFKWSSGLTSIDIPDSVTVIGNNAFSSCSKLSDVQLPKDLKIIGKWAFNNCDLEKLDIPDGVEEIGEYAFSDCDFTSVVIPDGITEIADWVFDSCINLKTVTLPESITRIGNSAFYRTKLTSIEIPDSVTYIGGSAFERCSELKNITLPDKLEMLSSHIFAECEKLEKIELPETLKSIGAFAFYKCVELQEIDIPAGVTEIGFYAFNHCKKLKFVVIPDGVKAIESYTFNYCTELSNVTLPSGLTTIGSNAFYGCKALEKIDIPKSVKNIQSNAFYKCSKLQDVELPDHLTYIQSGTFAFCTGLTDISFPKRLSTIGENAFKGCTGLTELTIPGHIRIVEDSAFMNCTGLVSVDIEYANLGRKVFEGCSNLEKVTLDDSVDTICEHAFKDCVKLKKVVLPKSLRYLGSEVFTGCTELTSVAFRGDAPLIEKNIYLSITRYSDNYGTNSLDGYSQKVYYPLDNKTWTEVSSGNYGGTATWVSEPPLPPSSSIATTPEKITLDWEPIDGAVKYEIYCSDAADGEFELLDTVTETKFEQEPPKLGYSRFYKLRSVDAAGNKSQFTEVFGVSTALQQVKVFIVEQPTETASGKPEFIWQSLDGAEKYEVWRATSEDGTYEKISTTAELNYTDASAAAGTTYYYKVRGVASTGMTGLFSTVERITATCAQPVTTLTVKASSGKPKLTWEKVEGAAKYEVWSATSRNGTYKRIFTTKGTVCTNTSAVAGTTYYYKVKAICAETPDGNSAFSAVKYITCDCAQPVMTLTVKASSGKPKLTWEKVEGAVKYEVWSATSKNGTYKRIFTTTGTVCTNTSAVAGATYYYKVKAICGTKSAGNSAFSAVKSITCDCARPVVTIGRNSSGKPRLKWDAVDGAVKYEVWRATSKDGKYTRSYTTTKTSYTNTSAKKGTTYYYKVKAICGTKSAGNSAFSTVKSIKSK